MLVYRLNIRGEHVMARDIDVHQVQLRGRHITLFQCTVHSVPPHRANNLVILNKYSSYTAVVGCLVYDCNSNDLISIHDSSDGPVGSHHWVVDNTIIGNAGSEQGFDFASPGGAYDVKFINNRVQCNSLPGLSTLTGSTRGGATAGKIDSFVWMVNNIITGSSGYGITTGGHNQATAAFRHQPRSTHDPALLPHARSLPMLGPSPALRLPTPPCPSPLQSPQTAYPPDSGFRRARTR